MVMELILPKPSIGQFSIEENEINIGDTILLKEQLLVNNNYQKMQVNDVQAEAVAGDVCTFNYLQNRLSDKL
jgi:UPF0176 protein